ncbi:hypothetical protein [Nitrosopumilus sp.]|uniref:hypothetical protein n=1 Tax=Nitrosopumilus sp. TaxID=2024843 RepID=UPI00292DEAEA|nr:hypothetical protein [Nitrosopumilus sp.]
MGIALHYFGSESTDANPNDEIGIHEDRRSKINDYFCSTWGIDPWEYDFIDGTVDILSITGDNGSIVSTNEFDHTWYDFSIDYNYQLSMDDDDVLHIERDPGNMRVLKYFYDENVGALESLEINGMIFEGSDLPECFKIKSPSACYLPVPEDHQLAKLNIIGTNIWGGISMETLPAITPEQLNPVVPDPIDSIFNLTMFDFVLILLVFMLIAYILYITLRWYLFNKI